LLLLLLCFELPFTMVFFQVQRVVAFSLLSLRQRKKKRVTGRVCLSSSL
jgi:hypothetical protein